MGIERQSCEGTLVGQVSTVTLAEGTPPPDTPKIHICARAIDSSDDQTVIVVSRPGLAPAAGGILTNAAQAKGVCGVIVDGRSRDIDESRAAFPVIARLPVARTARGRVYKTATDARVVIDGGTKDAGDRVIADTSGTVFITCGPD